MRWIFVLCFLGLVCSDCRGDSVNITIPSSLSFSVTNVNAVTAGSPNPFVISFTGLSMPSMARFYISVKASAANFTPPGGNAIPASNVYWTTGGAGGGTGSSGMLNSNNYINIYSSQMSITSGFVNVQWQLAAPGTGIRAGNHTLTIIYKLEAI